MQTVCMSSLLCVKATTQYHIILMFTTDLCFIHERQDVLCKHRQLSEFKRRSS